MPPGFAARIRFAEHGGQFVPTLIETGLRPHDPARTGYVDIFASRSNARQSNFYLDELTQLNSSRCGETYACSADILR
jgi:hypothetical protein